jgi:pimeloyl-ACP methyl ester carboxylesterase
MNEPHLIFSHGLDGSQWGVKITAMAEVARRYELHVESIDYANLDTAARVQRLLEACREHGRQFILVGSSLGAHVATTASTQVATRGLYLLAPAFFMPGFEQYTPKPAQCPVTIVHGWNDAVVPVENSIRFAQQYRCNLHIVDDDHRLQAQVDQVCDLFDRFLRRLGVQQRS